jgi:helix-turn-helix protein
MEYERIKGEARAELAAQMSREYVRGASIRELAATHDRTYGSVHLLLVESDTALRRRGGRRGRRGGKRKLEAAL